MVDTTGAKSGCGSMGRRICSFGREPDPTAYRFFMQIRPLPARSVDVVHRPLEWISSRIERLLHPMNRSLRRSSLLLNPRLGLTQCFGQTTLMSNHGRGSRSVELARPLSNYFRIAYARYRKRRRFWFGHCYLPYLTTRNRRRVPLRLPTVPAAPRVTVPNYSRLATPHVIEL